MYSSRPYVSRSYSPPRRVGSGAGACGGPQVRIAGRTSHLGDGTAMFGKREDGLDVDGQGGVPIWIAGVGRASFGVAGRLGRSPMRPTAR